MVLHWNATQGGPITEHDSNRGGDAVGLPWHALGRVLLIWGVFFFCLAWVPWALAAPSQGKTEAVPMEAGMDHTHPNPEASPDVEMGHQHPVSAGTGVGSENDPLQAPKDTPVLFSGVGISEHLGKTIPLDLTFRDEAGRGVLLKDLVDGPTLLQLVFYHCPQACSMMMASLASVLDGVTFEPGKEYRVVTVSFDHEETFKLAAETKRNYLKRVKGEFPADQWRFLTGDLAEIQRLTEAVGFRFKRLGQHNFVHPNALVVLGEDGVIIRYLYGLSYLPFDVSMALTEALRGTPAISIKKLMTYCFNYDPENNTYVFKTFQVSAVVILALAGVFLAFLLRNKKRGKPGE
ncbi:MAG: SCO family protein [Desulfobacterium sp.]|nr:SCO family protein [Desulfobacterium sp.]